MAIRAKERKKKKEQEEGKKGSEKKGRKKDLKKRERRKIMESKIWQEYNIIYSRTGDATANIT